MNINELKFKILRDVAVASDFEETIKEEGLTLQLIFWIADYYEKDIEHYRKELLEEVRIEKAYEKDMI